ncbi:MAG: hypothetical protein ABL962_00875 [Fimbriimonadaceae bacterium]
MRETYELRVEPTIAERFFQREFVHDLGSVWVVRLDSMDPRVLALTLAARETRAAGRGAILGWRIIRHYSKQEIAKAEWFHFKTTRWVMTCGEQCSTVYDETNACAVCGWGAIQTNLLALPLSKIGKGLDVSWTWADEWVASDKFRAQLQAVLGPAVRFAPILNCSRSQPIDPKPSDLVSGFWQLHCVDQCFEVLDSTVVRDHVIDQYPDVDMKPCPFGHSLGRHPISELKLKMLSLPKGGFCRTSNGFGRKQGYFRPKSEVVVNRAFYETWQTLGLRGAKFEIAHVENV